MTKEAFITKRFQRDSVIRIEQANDIIATYQRQGYRLTLRQLYYQFVSRDLIANTEQSYSKLGNLISDARLAGLIDWSAIEDRTRSLRALSSYDDPAELMQYTKYWYRLDKWATQPVRIEAWVEKEALLGVLERICTRYEVPYFACKGYVSSSEMYDAAKRYVSYIENGQDVILLDLGDHDPSGIDMTRDKIDRMMLFMGHYADQLQIKRLALNYDQILQYNPPPNPAKVTDSRFEDYARRFGVSSWELDALEPSVISNLIETAILAERDENAWALAAMQEANEKEQLADASRYWGDIATLIEERRNAQ